MGLWQEKIKFFLAKALQKDYIAFSINYSRFISYTRLAIRENLASKALDQQSKCVLDTAVKVVNYI